MSNALDRAYQNVSNRLGNFVPPSEFPASDWPGLDEIDAVDSINEIKKDEDIPTGKLNDDLRGLVDGGLREQGMEALALYKSFRFVSKPPFPGYWGIFYLDAGILRVSELIEGYGLAPVDACQMAVKFLRTHERLHFKFDVYALGVESILSQHRYEPLKLAFRNRKIFQVEEALANNEAWDWAKKQGPLLQQFAEDFMSVQPGAYARFSEDRHELSAELAANLIDLNFVPSARRHDQPLWVANLPTAMNRWQSYCKEYLVSASSVLSRWIDPAWKLPRVTDISDGDEVRKALNGRYATHRGKWKETKEKLLKEPGLPGLRFKPWDKSSGTWSVRIDDNFRAHLMPTDVSMGRWQAIELGPHKAMGHG